MADLTGDGLPDLAVANLAGSTVSVLIGSGGGAFHPAENFSSGSRPVSVTVADFDGDGQPDLAAANLELATASILRGRCVP